MVKKNTNISDVKNYNPHFSKKKMPEYSTRYMELIQQFIIYAQETLEIKDNERYTYIVRKGMNTIKSIFDFLFLYTKNIDLSIHNSRDVLVSFVSFYPHPEEEHKKQIQFHSKGAILFLYQKTIFNINQEYRKDYTLCEDDAETIRVFKQIQTIFDELLRIIIERDGKYIRNKDDYTDTMLIVMNIMNNILKFSKVNKYDYVCLTSNLKLQLHLLKKLSYEKIDTLKFLNIICSITKKLYNNKLTRVDIEKKLNDNVKMDEMLGTSPLKFANWMYSDGKTKKKKKEKKEKREKIKKQKKSPRNIMVKYVNSS